MEANERMAIAAGQAPLPRHDELEPPTYITTPPPHSIRSPGHTTLPKYLNFRYLIRQAAFGRKSIPTGLRFKEGGTTANNPSPVLKYL
ncbi:uncharacterized protein CLUP02_17425 [Colletotrichum lupini]|uniref:Uncharacterized protein n=1 Tax=Colletotrichum lupini TaxID=145971 RepID=A0A9Q8SEI0_9PEZI|nr:uncharacterized protein CLUP02_17425 [Colletotrichum lupini]UQC75916.1 hypothetical protein CLUP02_17425 [Colletotrichum lupini]